MACETFYFDKLNERDKLAPDLFLQTINPLI
jgi:hypothetical protein